MMNRKYALIPVFCFLFYSIGLTQIDPFCNLDDCGALDPSWQLIGDRTVACEGESFFLRSGESTPYDNIDSYTWILENTLTGEELDNVTYTDTIPYEFNYTVSDSIACLFERINIEVRLIVTSPTCAEGESCRFTVEPLTVILRPRAIFDSDNLTCINTPVTFTNESCNGESFAWDFDGDGTTDSTDPNPEYSFSTPGTYQVSLTATNECGSDVETRNITVVGLPEAQVELDPTGGELCAPDFQTITMVANEWVTSGPSGFFSWEISPGYEAGGWCFVDPDYNGTGQICLDDDEFNGNADSLLNIMEQLELYFTGPGSYEVTLTYGNVCEELTITETIVVNESPTIVGLSDQSGCDEVEVCYNSGIQVMGNETSLEWIFVNGSTSGSSTLDFGCVTFEANGMMILQVGAPAGCEDVADTINVTVITTQEVTVPDPDPTIICQNAGLIPLSPSQTGGEYFYNNAPADFISDDMLDPSGLAPGNYTVTYILGANTDCPAEDDFSFTIQEGPSITLGDNDPECESITNFNPNITAAGGDIDNWNWTVFDSSGGVVTTSTDESPLFNISIPGTYTIEVELTSDECGSVSDSSELIIQENVDASIIPVDDPYCQGSSPDTLSATPPGGMWSGSGIIDADLGIFDPSNLAPDNYDITYSITQGACSTSATQSIEVVASEAVMVQDTFFCVDSAPGQLVVSPTGGDFVGNGITDNVLGIFDPNLGDIGSNDITYTYVDTNDCVVISQIDVEVDDIPTLSLNDTIFVCIGTDDIPLGPLVSIDTNGESGTLSYEGPGITNSTTGTFNGSALAEGFYTITVDFNARACSAQDSFVIELASLPELILSEDDTVCITDGSLTLTANIPGGVWSSTNCSINPQTGEVNLADNGEGECTFQYTLNAATSCEQSETVRIVILDLANDLTVPDARNTCYSTDSYTIPNFSPLGGTWTGEGIIDAMNGVIDIAVLEQDTSYVYTYCITDDAIDCSACQDMVLTIDPLPQAGFSIAGSPCQNQPFGVVNSSTGAVNFEWDFGDGSPVSMDFEPMHTYTSAGMQTITLIAITSANCRDTIRQEINVTAPPVLDLVIDTDEGCAPLEIDYTNMSSGDGSTQFWIIDGIDTLFEGQPQIILDSVIMDSLITLEFVIANDCEILRQSHDVLVHPYPLVDFGINDDEGCSPDTVFFANATLGLPEDFLWDFGNGNTSTERDPDFQIYTSPDDSISMYTISLFASNVCGEGIVEKEILVYPNNVDAFFELDTLSGCPPLAVNVQNFATTGATIAYDFGDGGTGNTADTTYVYTEPGQYVITQFASLCGTDIFQSDTITVFPLADVDFDLPTFECIGNTVQFTNLSTGGVVSEWHFGDGATSDEINPTHVYTYADTFQVSLIVNSLFNDCPDTLTKSIFIPELPNPGFAVDTNAICPNGTISFQNTSTGFGDLSYEWDFGNEAGSEDENPSQTYPEPGTYEVVLTVYDDYGCSADTAFINLLVHPSPSSSFALSNNPICQFYDTLFVTNTSTGFVNSQWYLNDTFYSDQQDQIQLTFDEWGEQDIQLISTNAFECRDTSSQDFEVLPSPIAQANLVDTSGCQEFSVNFVSLSENTNLTSWQFDGNNTSADEAIVHTFVSHGSFPVTLIAGNTNGCPSDTANIDVEVFPRAIAEFVIASYDSCGVPVDLELINTSSFSSDYFWDFGNGSTSTFFEPLAEYTAPGAYEISFIASNDFGCPDTTSQSITLYPVTVASFDIPQLEYCEGDTITIVDNSTGVNTYEWFVNDLPIDSFPLVITESGSYAISLVASFDGQCPDDFSFGELLTVFDTPVAGFTSIADESQSIIGDVRFVNNSIDANSFLWEFGDGNTSNVVNPIYEYDIDGPVTVCLFAFNNNGGLRECVDKAAALITYERINTFFVPKALSPNQNFGNQEVQVFKPKGVGLESYELHIYSPWGDKVATLNKVLNGEPVDFWDGTFNGEEVPQGSYLWTAVIKYKSGQEEFQKGNVTVVR
ncbi:MAG: PKD domain-containing protein [Bacteroidota bacterium]